MPETENNRFRPAKIALVGNFLPRRCGIATFTSDLLAALCAENPDGDHFVVAMNDTPDGYKYPKQVHFEIKDRILADYRLAADFLNMNRVDVVCLQHEFGIFGGDNGAHVLELLNGLRMPLLTTLHTVIKEPNTGQMAITKRICLLSDRVVVMSRKAQEILHSVYGILPEKIVMIPHGIPDLPFVDPNFYKDQYGVDGRKVILTFGLLSPGKGIETMIDALPAIIESHPETVYIILGATHPNIRRRQGESYRISLQHRARMLGVGDHVIFHNRFVDQKELVEFLEAADIYVTPYPNREQIVSGTLAYALGSGKAIVSTPYWYAEEMLAEGRGRIVPFGDPQALAREINDLLSREGKRHAMRKRAYLYARNMVWKEVARQYLDVFSIVKRERESNPRIVSRARTIESVFQEIHQPKLDHIIRLTDGVGILQHAEFTVPNRHHGYCTDDNARALMAALMAREMLADSHSQVADNLACTYLSFLHYAFNEKNGRFRNFMSYDRKWLEEAGSEDSHGRALWSLGRTVAMADSEDIRGAALMIFEKALPAAAKFKHPRAWAFSIAGIHAYLSRYSGDSKARRICQELAGRLMRLYRENSSEDWPWIEDRLTYANGKIPQALLICGRQMENEPMLEAGLKSLEWLIEIQTDTRGHFVPVGNHGWYPRGGEKARFDQQPIEALHMIEACREAFDATCDEKWLHYAKQCTEWYLGRNDLNITLYDHKTGGCRDGLKADGPNRNQGAESTLVCFISLLTMEKMRARRIEIEAAAGK